MFLIVKDFQADVPGNIAYSVKEQTGGRSTVTVIMHSKKSLHQKAGDQQHFFIRFCNVAQCCFKKLLGHHFCLLMKYLPEILNRLKCICSSATGPKNF
jgi:hypothetical protein